MINSTLLKILASREDISDYVFHFTSGATALSTLRKILHDNAIIDVKAKGYICFTDAPITMLPDMFEIFKGYSKPMYAPYGIGIKKDEFFKFGGRPVIYDTRKGLSELPHSMSWRGVEYIPNEHDYSWLREWRINSRKVDLTKVPYIIITNTYEEAFDQGFSLDNFEPISKSENIGDHRGLIANGKFKRDNYSISLEEIKEANGMTKKGLQDLIAKQHKGDEANWSLLVEFEED